MDCCVSKIFTEMLVLKLICQKPTYGYELAQAVKDGYLVDYMSVETKLKFIEQGITYEELSAEEKESLAAIAKRTDTTISQIMRRLIRTFITTQGEHEAAAQKENDDERK